MKRLLPLADLAVIFDNSITSQPHEMLAFSHAGFMHWREDLPEWARHLRDE